jgi:hypothetical protein
VVCNRILASAESLVGGVSRKMGAEVIITVRSCKADGAAKWAETDLGLA